MGQVKEVSGFYSGNSSGRDARVERLQRYIASLEESERRISGEFAQQLREKDAEIQKLAGIIDSMKGGAEGRIREKEAEIGKLTVLLKSRDGSNSELWKKVDSEVREQRRKFKNVTGAVDRRESLYRGSIARLTEQLKRKDSELQKLRSRVGSSRVAKSGSLESELSELKKATENSRSEAESLRRFVVELEKSEKAISDGYAAQIEEKDRQVRKIVRMLKAREDANHALSQQLDSKARSEREYVGRIKHAIARKEQFNSDMIGKLTAEVSRKNEEISGLRSDIANQERAIRQLNSQSADFQRKMQQLQSMLYEKDAIKHRLEENFEKRLSAKDYEIARIGRELEKRMAGRLAGRGVDESAGLKIKLDAKEQQLSDITAQLADLKEKSLGLSKRLAERQKLYVESESNFNKLVSRMSEQHEKRVKELMHRAARREVALKGELEKLRASMQEKESLLAEKENRIDETLLRFTETSRNLLELKGMSGSDTGRLSAGLQEKEAYLAKKEEEIAGLIKDADERIRKAVEREKEVSRREAFLAKEQEGINTELSMIKRAGEEVGKEKDYLFSKISQYEGPAQKKSAGFGGVPELQPEPVKSQVQEVESEPFVPKPESAEEAPVLEAPEAAGSVQEDAFTPDDKGEDVLNILRKGRSSVAKKPASGGEDLLKAPPAPKGKAKVFRQARPKTRNLPRPSPRNLKAKVDRPKVKAALVKEAEKQDAFPTESGYGEVDEITSIIDIGLQHGDSVEQIRASLEASGYSMKNIDVAFSQVQQKKS